MLGTPARTIFTIGHSTRTFAEFLSLLEEHGIELLVDVRHFSGSRRVPWATAAILARDLPSRGIGYAHLEALADSGSLGRTARTRAGATTDSAAMRTTWPLLNFSPGSIA